MKGRLKFFALLLLTLGIVVAMKGIGEQRLTKIDSVSESYE